MNQAAIDTHVRLLCDSYRRWTGRPLLASAATGVSLSDAIASATFALVSHGTEADPVFNYANEAALKLFEMSLTAFTRLPSRQSAEPVNQQERARLMAAVTSQGYVDDYCGVRISASGRRFVMEQATVWNVVDANGRYHGQAARIDRWRHLPDQD